MNIACPRCNAAGSIPDHEIPEEGRFLCCPRCNFGFDIKRPKPKKNEYLVDVCPSCAYSTFGEERFAECPKCGVNIKTFIDRQREEKARARDQEILNRKFTRDISPPPVESAPSTSVSVSANSLVESIAIGEFVENLHPVKLTGWGCAAAGTVIILMGLSGLMEYFGGDIRGALSAKRLEEVSAWEVFLDYALLPWIQFLYGSITVFVSFQFLKLNPKARIHLTWCLWAAIAFVPVFYLTGIFKLLLDKIFHPFSNYLIEIFYLFFMSALVGIPLFLLIRFLDDRRITAAFR